MRGCYGPLTPAQLADLLASGNFTYVGGPYPDEATCQSNCSQPSGSGGSGSGGSGSGSGIDEGCPCDPLPLTLTATWTGFGACSAWTGMTALLNYNALSGNWVGSVVSPVDGVLYTFGLICFSSTTYTLEIFGPHGIKSADLIINSCSPLLLSLNDYIGLWGCHNGVGEDTVLVISD